MRTGPVRAFTPAMTRSRRERTRARSPSWRAYRGGVANEELGRTLRRLRELASLTQEELAERSGVSVDVIRHLEQGRKHSARLPTLHALANGLGVELTTLLGDPPAVSSTGENDGPRFVAVRRAIMPALRGPAPEPPGPDFSLGRLREQIADGWTQYHSAEFDAVMKALPDLISDARAATASESDDDRRAGERDCGSGTPDSVSPSR